MVTNLEPRIRALSRELLDKVIHRAQIDLAADYAIPLPMMVIAEMIGIPVGTVMSRLSRGRKQLRVKLADYATANGLGRKLKEGAYECV